MPSSRPRLEWPRGDPEKVCKSCCSFLSFVTFSFPRIILDRGRRLANDARRLGQDATNTSPLNEDDLPVVIESTRVYQKKLQNNWTLEKKNLLVLLRVD